MVNLPLGTLAYNEIKQKIINADYLPGALLSENELAEELKMSRTPIRSALSQLESEGFVETLKNRGILVKNISFKDILNMFEILNSMQAYVLDTAFQRKLSFDLDTLKIHLNNQLKAIDADDNYGYYVSGLMFTQTILLTLDNDYMLGILDEYKDKILAKHVGYRKLYPQKKPFYLKRTNEQVYEALLSGNIEHAKHALLGMVKYIHESMLHNGLV